MNPHGCAPAFRAPFPQIPAFEARCIRPGIVPLPRRTQWVRLGWAPRRRRRIDPLGARPLRERNPGGRPHCAPTFFLLRGYPSSAKLVVGRPPSCGDFAGPFRAVFTIRFRTDDPRPAATRPAGGRRPPGSPRESAAPGRWNRAAHGRACPGLLDPARRPRSPEPRNNDLLRQFHPLTLRTKYRVS